MNGIQFVLENFVGENGVILTGNETENLYSYGKFEIANKNEYHIFYNALYPKLVDSGMYFNKVTFAEMNIPVNNDNYTIEQIPAESSRLNNTSIYEIPDIAAMLIPHYVAGQLLVLDDKVRSIEEMNEFETLLATINTNRNERPRSYHSSKGWY